MNDVVVKSTKHVEMRAFSDSEGNPTAYVRDKLLETPKGQFFLGLLEAAMKSPGVGEYRPEVVVAFCRDIADGAFKTMAADRTLAMTVPSAGALRRAIWGGEQKPKKVVLNG